MTGKGGMTAYDKRKTDIWSFFGSVEKGLRHFLNRSRMRLCQRLHVF